MPFQGSLYVSAPGKIILFGEHAVVYGRTAVAGAINLRTFASLITSADQRIFLALPDFNLEKTWLMNDLLKASDKIDVPTSEPPPLDIIVPMARRLSGTTPDNECGVQQLAVLAFWYLLLGVSAKNKDMQAVKVTVRFKLPSCVGLGSSGAYCVSVAAVLLTAAGVIPSPQTSVDSQHGKLLIWEEEHMETIRKWATHAESLIHGRASGLDAAICTYGGIASFRPGTKIRYIKNAPDLKVLLINSKVERNTSRIVASIKDRLKTYPAVIEGIFNSIDAVSKHAIKILQQEEDDGCGGEPGSCIPAYQANGVDFPSDVDSVTSQLSQKITAHYYYHLNELSRMNNSLLVALGVGHPKVDQICTVLSRYGIQPKMTGAGSGGCVYAFLKPDTSSTVVAMICKEIEQVGFELWQPELGGYGVALHESKPDGVFSS